MFVGGRFTIHDPGCSLQPCTGRVPLVPVLPCSDERLATCHLSRAGLMRPWIINGLRSCSLSLGVLHTEYFWEFAHSSPPLCICLVMKWLLGRERLSATALSSRRLIQLNKHRDSRIKMEVLCECLAQNVMLLETRCNTIAHMLFFWHNGSDRSLLLFWQQAAQKYLIAE